MFLSSLFLFFAFVSSESTEKNEKYSTPIRHIVVTMLENRAFDHMLGYLYQINPEKYNFGLTGHESCPLNPNVANSQEVKVSFDAPNSFGLDPGHSVMETEVELYGRELSSPNKPFPEPKMNGFIYEHSGTPMVMRCYNDSSIPALYTMAQEFALFQKWYASIPGPTEVNRMFYASGQSYGAATNVEEMLILGYPQQTIFDQLAAEGRSFKIYFSDFSTMFFMRNNRRYWEQCADIEEFYIDAANGNLPEFTFVEPRYFNFLLWKEADQHPHSDSQFTNGNVILGEAFFRDVYGALRNSPLWNATLFFANYDEHGGMFDHVAPPQDNIPPPNDMVSTDPPFNFDRLGLRVPAVAVSPWVDRGKVIDEPAKNHFDHTSMIGTVRKLLNLQSPPLTAREAWSADFADIFRSEAQGPRDDCPTHLPVSPFTSADRLALALYEKGQATPMTDANIAREIERLGGVEAARALSDPITDFQEAMVLSAAGFARTEGEEASELVLAEAREAMRSEFDSARFIRKQMKKLLARNKR